jgi:hypothetical protein
VAALTGTTDDPAPTYSIRLSAVMTADPLTGITGLVFPVAVMMGVMPFPLTAYTTRPSGAGRSWVTSPLTGIGVPAVFVAVSTGSTLLPFATYTIAGVILAVRAAAGDVAPRPPRAATAMRAAVTHQYPVLRVPAGIPVSPR